MARPDLPNAAGRMEHHRSFPSMHYLIIAYPTGRDHLSRSPCDITYLWSDGSAGPPWDYRAWPQRINKCLFSDLRATHSRPYNSTIHDTRSRASTKDFGPDAQLPVLERTRVDRCIMLATAPSTSNDVRHQRLCASLYLSPVVQSGYLESPNKCLR